MMSSLAVMKQKDDIQVHITNLVLDTGNNKLQTVFSSFNTPTNANEDEANDVGEDISSERFITFSITLFKKSNIRVYVVSAQTLEGKEENISL